uniref:Ras-associating domain-containing protein n=1 Tax=Tetraodon nigroviridis TaxID=99883 RepID=H3DPS6_TETNG
GGKMPEEEEREKLAKVISQWNSSRLDLFEISQPDENLEFHGVMRFYLEDGDGGNVATKCLRVCSSSSTIQVIQTLSEKFRPDAKALRGKYSLFEIHKLVWDEERKLDLEEKPLAVQLNWTADNREGRFVLKTDKDSLEVKKPSGTTPPAKDKGGVIRTFKRTLSRKEKKNKQKGAEKDSMDETEEKEPR